MVRYLVASAALGLAAPAVAQTTLLPGETLLQIQAVGEASAQPDQATMSIGVISTGATARAATDANAAQMTAVVAALRSSGVEPRFIRTQQINVQPRFARSSPTDYEGQARITGYVARNSVGVTINRLAIAPDVIAAAFAAGANSVNGPNLALRDDTAAVAAARRDAIAKARAEAEAYADGLGLKLGRVIRVSERGNAASPELYGSGMSYNVSSPAPPLASGEIRQRATVWIDYALMPK